jgi:hypothetical protein
MKASLLSPLALAASLGFAAQAAPVNDAAAPDAAETGERVTSTSEGRVADHAADELRDPRSFETLRRAAGSIETKSRVGAGKAFSSTQAVYGDTYVYDATTDLFADRDGDGYFHRLRVRFDADTATSSVVYAEIYVSADGKAWELLYTTRDFSVVGSDPNDDYEVETDLVSGYTAGRYDVLIELHDSANGTLLDEYGPNESPLFSQQPLEDSTRDGVPPVTGGGGHGGGGAVSWTLLPGLLGVLVLERRRRAAAAASAR